MDVDDFETTDTKLDTDTAHEEAGAAGARGEDAVKWRCPDCGRPMDDQPVGLTERQFETLVFINRHINANGTPPSYDQIRGALGLHSKSGVHRYVNALVERGALVTRPYRARAMTITLRGLNTIRRGM